MDNLCIGLFGTCGGSNWRDAYLLWSKFVGVDIFDPQNLPSLPPSRQDRCAAVIENEIQHLNSDPILMFKITGKPTSLINLQEILVKIQNPTQFVVILIENLLGVTYKDYQGDQNDNLSEDAVRFWAHEILSDINSPMVTLVESDEEAQRVLSSAADYFKASGRYVIEETRWREQYD